MTNTSNIEKYNSEDIPMREVYEGIDCELNKFITEHEGKSITIIGENFNHGLDLFEIETFAKKVASSNSLGFTVTKTGHGKTVIPLALSKYFSRLNSWSGVFYRYAPSAFISTPFATPPEWRNLPTFTFNPHVTAVFDSLKKLGLLKETFTKPILVHRPGVIGAELFNELITSVRETTKSAEYKKRVKSVENNYRRNLKSYTKYFNALLDEWEVLLVLRLDFFFPTDQIDHISVENAHAARERFLNNMRGNRLFANLVGGIWKLEWGNGRDGKTRHRGHHFHFILLFDAAKQNEERRFADQIGEYWKSQIAPGGSYNSCHKNPNQYKRRGIGMISHDEAQKREIFLKHVLGYLFLEKQCLMVKPYKGRMIGRMEMPKARMNTPGRPRKKAL
jgi:hypothetical protein